MKIQKIALLFIAFCTLISCQDNDDTIKDTSINSFVWRGLNTFYLWQAEVPNLADSKFANQTELNTFLQTYTTPETLFQNLLYKPASLYPAKGAAIDRFSWIVKDYTVLENQLQGNTNSNGVEFELNLKPNSSTEVIGWVKYIVPNSDASNKNIKRGEVFTGVDGTPLTTSNYSTLLFGNDNDYTLNMADINNGAFTANGKTVALTKTALTENPILINKVITVGNKKIGYLMYNGFYSNFDLQLNTVFANFQTQGITDLVLDLRYNGGGSVQSATYLASMITGQFTGQVFAKQQWNAKIEAYYASNNPDSLKDFFTNKIGTTALNSVGMTKVYVLTTTGTASASELIINGLKPHINVVQIGETTVGKNVGSITVYDSPTFGKTNRNPNHKYAMQPLVIKIVNSAGYGDYQNGLTPNVLQQEYINSLGVLGDASEPLLATAIGKITGSSKTQQRSGINLDYLSDSKYQSLIRNSMYVDGLKE